MIVERYLVSIMITSNNMLDANHYTMQCVQINIYIYIYIYNIYIMLNIYDKAYVD